MRKVKKKNGILKTNGMIFVILMFVVLFAVGYLVVYEKYYEFTTDNTLDFILEHVTGSGEIFDVEGKICVESIDDVKLYVKDDRVKIKFGKMTLLWELEDFLATENLNRIGIIGITVDQNLKTGEMKVFYQGTELERWEW